MPNYVDHDLIPVLLRREGGVWMHRRHPTGGRWQPLEGTDGMTAPEAFVYAQDLFAPRPVRHVPDVEEAADMGPGGLDISG
jgi:hypothetical protein